MTDWFEQLEREGFALLPEVFSPGEVRAAQESCAAAIAAAGSDPSVLIRQGGPAYGVRNLFRLWPEVVALARKPALATLLLRILGPHGGLTRGLYFDKPPGNSWALPWHRDLTIAVKEHGPLGYFTNPTTKAGVPHVQAPTELLSRMVTVRIHLDRVTDSTGPLRVVPGSHDLAIQVGDREPVTVFCEGGDVLLMRPLLLHASGHSEPELKLHRRIVHLEFAPTPELAEGYQWHDYFGIAELR